MRKGYGVTETRISFDYETFSVLSVVDVGGWRYSQDKSTEVLCFAWAFDDEEPLAWHHGCDSHDLKELFKAIRGGCLIKAWNANFERAITENVAARQLGFPIPKLNQWRCTQARAAMCALPLSLGPCAEALGVEEKKDTDGKRLLNLFSQLNRGKRVRPEDSPDEFHKLVEYCKQDVRTERAIDAALPIAELPPFERRLWALDSQINRRGVYIDRKMCLGAMKILRDFSPEKIKQCTDLTGGIRPSQVQKLTAWVREKGVNIKGLGKEVLDEVLLDDDLDPQVREVLEVRLMMGKSSSSKYAKALEVMGGDQRVRGVHRYHKATTGRWTGTLTQFQNLARPSEKTHALIPYIRRGDTNGLLKLHPICYRDPVSILRDSVRHMVQAPHGRMLAVADLAAIEGRVLAWQAGEEWKLAAYRRGEDLYSITASWIFELPLEEIDREEHRPLGKESDLGLGYSMAWKTFKENCRKKKIIKPEELFKRTVKVWRKRNPMIVQSWADLEQAAVRACGGSGRIRANKFISFEMIENYLTMLLPSGRRLWYPEAEVRSGRLPWGDLADQVTFMSDVNGQWRRGSTYGGRLVENAVQAIARDALAESMVLAESRGIPIVMHVHDEIVAEIEEEGASVDPLLECFRTVPTWAKGLPLNAAGFLSRYYKKG